MKRNRQTKIVATLGPASNTEKMIETLFLAGVDMFRMNFSHGTHADHKKRIDIIRDIEKKHKRPIAILADMQGPKLRVGKFKNDSIALKIGQKLTLDLNDAPGDEKRVQLPHPEIFEVIEAGAEILADDGKVRLKIVRKKKDALECEVLAGHKLSNNKGVNVPGVVLPISALTPKDLKDLDAALDMGVDWIALSFVQRPQDVADAKKIIKDRAAVMIKLEKPSALTCLSELIDMCDGVMLARGDLGVEIPAEEVPTVQKRVVRDVRAAGKPVIVATQMLESMIENPRPTRAEASDVATAVYDGSDAVMLSAETAAGQYPEEAVRMMDKICISVERDALYRRIMDAEHPEIDGNAADAITASAYNVAGSINAAAIVNYTTSGSTTLRTARQRPLVPILCLTSKVKTARRLSLSYGVHAVHSRDISDFDDMAAKATRIAVEQGLAKKGQRIVITAGVPFGTPGTTNVLRVAWV